MFHISSSLSFVLIGVYIHPFNIHPLKERSGHFIQSAQVSCKLVPAKKIPSYFFWPVKIWMASFKKAAVPGCFSS